jgi:hypothetical protein
MNHVQEWVDFFEHVSCFHREMFMKPLWNRYPNYGADIWDSLAIFLEGYAFERPGRRPDYSHAAVDALFYCREENNNFNQNTVNMIWCRFMGLLNNQRLNPMNNPLRPAGNPDDNRSVIQVVIENDIVQENLTLTTYLINLINQHHDIQQAFNSLTCVRGIGRKIASLYLRDLVDIMNIDLVNIHSRNLLQPIDIWVERTIKILNNNQNMNMDQVADWLVQNSVNPERVNMGIWFFCSQIIASEYKLNRVLDDLNTAQNLLQNYRNKLENICLNC